MKSDIISDNYLRSHKYSYIFSTYAILILCVYFLKLFKLLILTNPFDLIFEILHGVLLLIILIDLFLFIRIGELELNQKNITTKINRVTETIQLDTIKISSTNKNHYFLSFDSGFKVMIELKNEQLKTIKKSVH